MDILYQQTTRFGSKSYHKRTIWMSYVLMPNPASAFILSHLPPQPLKALYVGPSLKQDLQTLRLRCGLTSMTMLWLSDSR